MKQKISRFDKLFGSGPLGLIVSLLLLLAAIWIDGYASLPRISDNATLRLVIFIVSCVIALVLVVGSFTSLPALQRGEKLCTDGIFRYLRHPLYAAFLSSFNIGLAIMLNSYVILAWALLLHPVWHVIVGFEERMMVDVFGKEYEEYQKRTGRFFPHLY